MLQKCSIYDVAKVFFDEPSRDHYLKEISRKAGIAHTSTSNHIRSLLRSKIVTKSVERRGKRSFPIYKASMNVNFQRQKRIFNLMRIYNSGLIKDLQEIMPTSIVLFGSYAYGEDTEDSDIDIYMDCKKSEISLKKFESKLKRKIELHFQDHKKLPTELKSNIANGIVLDGYLEI